MRDAEERVRDRIYRQKESYKKTYRNLDRYWYKDTERDREKVVR